MKQINTIFIDVREPTEFNLEHIPHSKNIPLSQFSESISSICTENPNTNFIFLCQSGNRAKKALEIWNQNTDKPAEVLEGGLSQWKMEKKSIFIKKNKLPIMQQVQLIVGILLIIISLLTYFMSINLIIMIVFIGLGLTFAGLTGFCGLALILLKMPWNASKK